MNHSRKMILLPSEIYETQQIGSAEQQPNQELPASEQPFRYLNKIYKLLNIVLKIALKGGYNEDFRINDSEGNPIVNTNIAKLIQAAVSPDKLIVGEKDFVRLLYEANVDPNWIVNQRLRHMLSKYRPTRPKTLNISQPDLSTQISTQYSPQQTNFQNDYTQYSPQQPTLQDYSTQYSPQPVYSGHVLNQTSIPPPQFSGPQSYSPTLSQISESTYADMPSIESRHSNSPQMPSLDGPYPRVNTDPRVNINTRNIRGRKRKVDRKTDDEFLEWTGAKSESKILKPNPPSEKQTNLERKAWQIPLPSSSDEDDL